MVNSLAKLKTISKAPLASIYTSSSGSSTKTSKPYFLNSIAAAATLTAAASLVSSQYDNVSFAEFTEHVGPNGNKYTYDTLKRQIVNTAAIKDLKDDIEKLKEAVNANVPEQKILQSNIVLSDRHRVGLCEWPADQCNHNGESRTASAHALFQHVKKSGYDGVEMTVGYFAKYFRNCSREQTALSAKKMASEYGLEIFGANIWWVWDYPEMNWEAELKKYQEEARLTKLMGGEYLTFQIWLPEKYQGTAGEYRMDEEFLNQCASRISDLQQACWNEGLNCYIETHVQRISEDPQAFAAILKRCADPVETNGDLSHYIYRNFKNNTKDMNEILERMGHTHQRMCRGYGDLSANVDNTYDDWKGYGVTWKAFDFSKPGLKGGLSSRVICGESGPMHGVNDPLTLDAKLVPLYRMMARWADASANGIDLDIQPTKYNPFQKS
jgi:sugar phosphate isomerase/epimerase